MSRRRGLIVTEDEEVQDEELNPFSFKEFLRWKHQDQEETQEDQEETQEDQEEMQEETQKEMQGETQEDQEETQEEVADKQSCAARTVPQRSLTCLSFQERRGRSFSSGVERSCTHWMEEEELEEGSRPGGAKGGEGGAAAQGGGAAVGKYNDTSFCKPAACGRRSSLLQELQEENAALRRSVEELQRSAAASERKAGHLKEELLQTRRREEKEAQDLESMVQSVEHNLRLMTRRAVKAESCVSKLRAELQQLQADLVCVRSDNDRLKAAESQVVMTMRQNAQVASEYLNKTASHAHSSIQKLLGEAESLRLVSALLRSIDQISSAESES